jgi:signal transduction histidine kinase/CheY-like chemotaxis protein
MADSDDLLTLIDDRDDPAPDQRGKRWKIAVIDDDEAVHEGTRFALADYQLGGMGLEIVSARSAEEGRALLRAHPDIAAVLLDVVMESETAGLELVDFIRRDLGNDSIRIILRTGQPGQAPEKRVILDYDINDYKAKTELTADKLFTSLTAALRSHQQIQRMEETRRGLEIIVDAASTLFDFKSMQRLAEGVLTQIGSILNVDCAGILVLRDTGSDQGGVSVLAGSGCYRQYVRQGGLASLDPEVRDLVEHAFACGRTEYLPRHFLIYIRTASGREVVVLLDAGQELSSTNRALVEVFCSRLAIAFDNVLLYQQLQDANALLDERVKQRTRELTSANQRLQAQWARLRRANAFQSELLGTVAHDLKNPLSVILGRTEILGELLASGQSSSSALDMQVEHIRKSARYLTTLVDRLIADAMTDALDISVRREPNDLALLLRQVVDANRPMAERKQQTIQVDAPPSLTARFDPDRLEEAVDNLVSNAIKYSPIGERIAVSGRVEDGEVVIRVRDNGPGLSSEDVGRLFGRFQRLSAKPTAGEGSTGLGLWIAKRIVELHEGRLEASSEGPAKGSTFVVSLPSSGLPE